MNKAFKNRKVKWANTRYCKLIRGRAFIALSLRASILSYTIAHVNNIKSSINSDKNISDVKFTAMKATAIAKCFIDCAEAMSKQNYSWRK